MKIMIENNKENKMQEFNDKWRLQQKEIQQKK